VILLGAVLAPGRNFRAPWENHGLANKAIVQKEIASYCREIRSVKSASNPMFPFFPDLSLGDAFEAACYLMTLAGVIVSWLMTLRF
jgi:hypothetical protein